MRRLNKTMRSRQRRQKLQRKQRSRRLSRHRKTRRHRQRGGDLPVPAGAIVAVSTGGEYGLPVLMSKTSMKEKKREGA